jgi:integrase/recombinase XerD
MGRPTTPVSEVVIAGPLACFAADFRSALRDTGHTPLSAVTQLRLMAHLSLWLDAGGLTAADLTGERIEAYLRARRAAGRTWLCSRRGLTPLLDVLAARRALPADPPPVPGSPTDVLLAAFGRYLRSERGLDASTAAAYVARAARFLSRCAPDRELGTLTARDVTAAVLAESATHSVGATQYFVAALRAFLRFCHLEGWVGADLSAAALSVTGRRTSSLPQGISPAAARALLHSCDRRRAIGRRDYAVLVTLLRLGLRASEVTALALNAIDWRAGEIVVHGKGRRADRLPLPADVGEAISGYLQRGRPKTARREVFLTAVAPIAPLLRGAISSIVRRACRRAGVAPVGAHRLRHTLACAMVRSGVPLPGIGQVLRHRSLASTAIYARVDVEALRRLAQPWPGGPIR